MEMLPDYGHSRLSHTDLVPASTSQDELVAQMRATAASSRESLQEAAEMLGQHAVTLLYVFCSCCSSKACS